MEYNGMKATITATEFKINLGKYLDSAVEGQVVVITKNGKEAAILLPYSSTDNRNSLFEEAVGYSVDRENVSYDEFMEINEKSEATMEYINGKIVLQASPNVKHQAISGKIHLILSSYLNGKECRVYYAPFDVQLNKTNHKIPDVLQPDLLIACDIAEKIDSKGKYTGTPTLVVEIVSPGTRTKDMVDKLNTYMLSGVREFWVVDPEQNVILVYGFKTFAVDHFEVYKQGEKIISYFFDGLEADVNGIINA